MKTLTKNLLIILSLIFSLNSQAGILWFLLGAGAAGSQKAPQSATQSDLQVLIASIEKQLPSPCNATVYTSCWNQYTKPSIPFLVPPKQSLEIHSYFTNKGYEVATENDQLIFNFASEHQNYLAHQKIWGSLELYFLILMSAGFIGMFYFFQSGYRKKVKNVKRVYALTQGRNLIFQNQTNKEVLEKHLQGNCLPVGWHVNIADDQILRITKTSDHGIEAIATSIEAYRKLFQQG